MTLSDASVARLRAVTERPDLSGTRYEIVREIGRGGMGVVYEAAETALHRTVALKVLAPEWSQKDAADRLRQEARTIARLEHPGIVPVHDVGETRDGRVFYAMKLVRGASLADYMQRHSRAELLRVFLRVCETVAYAHSCGVVHRDLKPENIMVGEFGEVLVLDWGVALAGEESVRAVVGTHAYMSPEQSRGDAHVGPPSDVFSLGRVLQGIVAATSEKTSRRLRAIVEKATHVYADARYGDARELAADVTRLIDGEPVLAHRETVFERSWRWADRHRALLAMIAVYLVMRIALILWSGR